MMQDPITVDDNDGSCKTYCGYRAYWGDAEFPKSASVKDEKLIAKALGECSLESE